MLRRSTGALPCPRCEYAYTKIMDAMATKNGYRRRRVCLRCKDGFITYEVPTNPVKEVENDHRKCL